MSVSQKIEKIQGYIRKKQHLIAVKELFSLILKFPSNPRLANNLEILSGVLGEKKWQCYFEVFHTLYKEKKYAECLSIFNYEPLGAAENLDFLCLSAKCYILTDEPRLALINLQLAQQISRKSVQILEDMGVVYFQLANTEKELECYENILRLEPNHIPARINAINSYMDIGDVVGIKRILDLFKMNQSMDEQTALTLSEGYLFIGDPGAAKEVICAYLNDDKPRDRPLFHLAKSNWELGLRQLASSQITELIEKNFELDNTLPAASRWGLTNTEAMKQKFTEALDKSKHPQIDPIPIKFSYADTLDRQGDYISAFGLYHEANELLGRNSKFQLSQYIELLKKVERCAQNIEASLIDSLNEECAPQPIFIVSMPRSGSTLTEQILSSHSDVCAGDELTFWTRNIKKILLCDDREQTRVVSELARSYQKHLSDLSNGEKFVTDKMPDNFLFLELLRKIFPKSRFIDVRRLREATCWSIYTSRFKIEGYPYSTDLSAIWKFYSFYDDCINRKSGQGWDNFYTLNYDSLTQNQESETRSLLSFCGLDFELNCMNFHKNSRKSRTKSSYQVQQKMYTGSSEKWKNYEKFLTGYWIED